MNIKEKTTEVHSQILSKLTDDVLFVDGHQFFVQKSEQNMYGLNIDICEGDREFCNINISEHLDRKESWHFYASGKLEIYIYRMSDYNRRIVKENKKFDTIEKIVGRVIEVLIEQLKAEIVLYNKKNNTLEKFEEFIRRYDPKYEDKRLKSEYHRLYGFLIQAKKDTQSVSLAFENISFDLAQKIMDVVRDEQKDDK